MATTFSSGVNFSWPTKRDTNYSATVNEALAVISAHRHEGGGTGVQLGAAAFAANALTGAKFRLANAEYLRARNAANSADVNLLRLNASNAFELGASGVPVLFANTQTISTAVATTITANYVNLSSAGPITVPINVPTASQSGQPVLVYNSGAGTVTLTITGRPAANDSVPIPTLCAVILYPIGTTTWALIAGAGVTPA